MSGIVALSGLPDLAARRAWLTRRLADEGAGGLAAVSEAIWRAAATGEESGREAGLALATWAIHLRSAGRGAEVDAVAAAGGALTALAFDDAAATRALPARGRLAEVALSSEGAPTLPTDRWGPGGVRGLRSLGCVRWPVDAHYAERARLHPSPVFTARLLEKRWLRPRDVLVMASRRPTTAALAWAIALRDEHVGKLAVREALVQNPFTPGAIALVLLPTVGERTLGRCARAGEVSKALERFARLLVETRHAAPSEKRTQVREGAR